VPPGLLVGAVLDEREPDRGQTAGPGMARACGSTQLVRQSVAGIAIDLPSLVVNT
jgi:hypothetical protein